MNELLVVCTNEAVAKTNPNLWKLRRWCFGTSYRKLGLQCSLSLILAFEKLSFLPYLFFFFVLRMVSISQFPSIEILVRFTGS